MRIVFLWQTLHEYFIHRYIPLTDCHSVYVIEYFQKVNRYPTDILRKDFPFHSFIMDRPIGDSRLDIHTSIKTIKILNKIQPEVLVIPGYSDFITNITAAWAKLNGITVIMWFASTSQDKLRSIFKEKIKGYLLKLCDGIAVPGKRHLQYAKKLGADSGRIKIIGNGIANFFFQEAAGEARLQEDELRKRLHLPKKFFLYVGALSPEKNLRRTLLAYQAYREKMDREAWNFVIVGTGAEEPLLRNTLNARTLESIQFLGFLPWQELGTIYGLASCFILPSLSETWGLVVNEAMAAGLPVLVSKRCGCVPELVEEGRNGYTFDPRNVSQIAELMALLSQDENEYKRLEMGLASQQMVQKMDHGTWASGLMRLIVECLARK